MQRVLLVYDSLPLSGQMSEDPAYLRIFRAGFTQQWKDADLVLVLPAGVPSPMLATIPKDEPDEQTFQMYTGKRDVEVTTINI